MIKFYNYYSFSNGSEIIQENLKYNVVVLFTHFKKTDQEITFSTFTNFNLLRV